MTVPKESLRDKVNYLSKEELQIRLFSSRFERNKTFLKMKTDLYTKGVLSVIAVALVTLVIQNSQMVNEAKAGNPNFNSFASIPINEDGSINVKMLSDMDVNIHSIGGSSIYGALPINLKEIGGSSFYGSLPINIKEMNGSAVNSAGIPVNIESVDGMSVYSAIPVKESK